MSENKSSKKITRVGDHKEKTPSEGGTFEPSAENAGKAKQFRIIAGILFLLAIGSEVGGILVLRKPPVNMTWLIVFIIIAMILAIGGSLLWKKANRLDPASEKDKVRFFIQNQLGAILAVVAFLPLIILIFTNKDLTGKQKGIAGTVGIVAMLVAGYVGIDFDPPSQEEYQEQIEKVEALNDGTDFVYWTKSGKSYHLYQDCSYINSVRTDEIFEGSTGDAKELKNITDLCDRCENRATKEAEETIVDENLETEETEQE